MLDMNKFAIIWITTTLLLCSCISNNKFVYGKTVTAGDLEAIDILGLVETNFEYSNNMVKDKVLLERSYYELLKAAQKNYPGNIDICNIVVEKRHTGKNTALFIAGVFGYIGPLFMNVYAKGSVILP